LVQYATSTGGGFVSVSAIGSTGNAVGSDTISIAFNNGTTPTLLSLPTITGIQPQFKGTTQFSPDIGGGTVIPGVNGVPGIPSSGVGLTPNGAFVGTTILFFLGCENENSISFTPPSGVTLLVRTNHTGSGGYSFACAIYYITLISTPPDSFTFTSSGGSGNPIDVFTVNINCSNSSSLIDAYSSNDNYTSSAVGLSVNASTTTDILIWFWYSKGNIYVSPPAGLTTLLNDVLTLAGDSVYGSFYETLSLSGATGNVVGPFDGGSSYDWISFMVALKPNSIVSYVIHSTDVLSFGMI
jgi:hypothetical protein